MADDAARARSRADDPQAARSWLDRALAPLTVVIPFGVALARAASGGQWRGDLPAVRDLGLVAVGVGGGASTVISQALSLLPLGSRSFRAALGSAVAVAVSSRLLYALVRRTLAAAGPSPKLAAGLAFVATLTVALAPTWQSEATVGGGVMVAVAAALGAISIGLSIVLTNERGARALVGAGACTGIALAECPPAGLAAVVALGAAAYVASREGHAPRGLGARSLWIFTGSALAVFAPLLAPLALRPIAPRAFADVGRVLSASSLSSVDVQGTGGSALAAWSQEIGVVSLAIAAFGAVIAVMRPRLRPWIAPFLALVALDALMPARVAGVLSADAWSAVRALAIASVALASALGVHEVVSVLLRARVPMAKSAAVLVVAFHFTLVALTSEEAGFAADRSEQLGGEAWADEAFERLPPSAAVLVRSPALAWRLWAARLTRGERPDVLVIPVALLDRGSVAASLLERRRDTEPLLRSYALTGEPSEYALSRLADVHPLSVELDRTWSKRILSHLSPAGLWLDYAAQPLGPSDRKVSSAAALAPARRLLALLAASSVNDPSTAAVLAETLRGHATVLVAVGDAPSADQFMDRAAELAEREPFLLTRPLPYALKGLRRVIARRNEPSPKPTNQAPPARKR